MPVDSAAMEAPQEKLGQTLALHHLADLPEIPTDIDDREGRLAERCLQMHLDSMMLTYTPNPGRMATGTEPVNRFEDQGAKRKIYVNKEVLGRLMTVAEELNKEQAQVEVRKLIRREQKRIATEGTWRQKQNGLEPEAVQEILRGMDVQGDEELPDRPQLRPPGAKGWKRVPSAFRTAQVRYPAVLARKAPKDRWGYFRALQRLIPAANNARPGHIAFGSLAQPPMPMLARVVSRAAGSRSLRQRAVEGPGGEVVVAEADAPAPEPEEPEEPRMTETIRGAVQAHCVRQAKRAIALQHAEEEGLTTETWWDIMQKRKRTVYFRQLLGEMKGKMDMIRLHMAARTIQKSWRHYKSHRKSKASVEIALLQKELAQRKAMEAALRAAAEAALAEQADRERLAARKGRGARPRTARINVPEGQGEGDSRAITPQGNGTWSRANSSRALNWQTSLRGGVPQSLSRSASRAVSRAGSRAVSRCGSRVASRAASFKRYAEMDAAEEDEATKTYGKDQHNLWSKIQALIGTDWDVDDGSGSSSSEEEEEEEEEEESSEEEEEEDPAERRARLRRERNEARRARAAAGDGEDEEEDEGEEEQEKPKKRKGKGNKGKGKGKGVAPEQAAKARQVFPFTKGAMLARVVKQAVKAAKAMDEDGDKAAKKKAKKQMTPKQSAEHKMLQDAADSMGMSLDAYMAVRAKRLEKAAAAGGAHAGEGEGRRSGAASAAGSRRGTGTHRSRKSTHRSKAGSEAGEGRRRKGKKAAAAAVAAAVEISPEEVREIEEEARRELLAAAEASAVSLAGGVSGAVGVPAQAAGAAAGAGAGGDPDGSPAAGAALAAPVVPPLPLPVQALAAAAAAGSPPATSPARPSVVPPLPLAVLSGAPAAASSPDPASAAAPAGPAAGPAALAVGGGAVVLDEEAVQALVRAKLAARKAERAALLGQAPGGEGGGEEGDSEEEDESEEEGSSSPEWMTSEEDEESEWEYETSSDEDGEGGGKRRKKKKTKGGKGGKGGGGGRRRRRARGADSDASSYATMSDGEVANADSATLEKIRRQKARSSKKPDGYYSRHLKAKAVASAAVEAAMMHQAGLGDPRLGGGRGGGGHHRGSYGGGMSPRTHAGGGGTYRPGGVASRLYDPTASSAAASPRSPRVGQQPAWRPGGGAAAPVAVPSAYTISPPETHRSVPGNKLGREVVAHAYHPPHQARGARGSASGYGAAGTAGGMPYVSPRHAAMAAQLAAVPGFPGVKPRRYEPKRAAGRPSVRQAVWNKGADVPGAVYTQFGWVVPAGAGAQALLAEPDPLTETVAAFRGSALLPALEAFCRTMGIDSSATAAPPALGTSSGAASGRTSSLARPAGGMGVTGHAPAAAGAQHGPHAAQHTAQRGGQHHVHLADGVQVQWSPPAGVLGSAAGAAAPAGPHAGPSHPPHPPTAGSAAAATRHGGASGVGLGTGAPSTGHGQHSAARAAPASAPSGAAAAAAGGGGGAARGGVGAAGASHAGGPWVGGAEEYPGDGIDTAFASQAGHMAATLAMASAAAAAVSAAAGGDPGGGDGAQVGALQVALAVLKAGNVDPAVVRRLYPLGAARLGEMPKKSISGAAAAASAGRGVMSYPLPDLYDSSDAASSSSDDSGWATASEDGEAAGQAGRGGGTGAAVQQQHHEQQAQRQVGPQGLGVVGRSAAGAKAGQGQGRGSPQPAVPGLALAGAAGGPAQPAPAAAAAQKLAKEHAVGSSKGPAAGPAAAVAAKGSRPLPQPDAPYVDEPAAAAAGSYARPRGGRPACLAPMALPDANLQGEGQGGESGMDELPCALDEPGAARQFDLLYDMTRWAVAPPPTPRGYEPEYVTVTIRQTPATRQRAERERKLAAWRKETSAYADLYGRSLGATYERAMYRRREARVHQQVSALYNPAAVYLRPGRGFRGQLAGERVRMATRGSPGHRLSCGGGFGSPPCTAGLVRRVPRGWGGSLVRASTAPGADAGAGLGDTGVAGALRVASTPLRVRPRTSAAVSGYGSSNYWRRPVRLGSVLMVGRAGRSTGSPGGAGGPSRLSCTSPAPRASGSDAGAGAGLASGGVSAQLLQPHPRGRVEEEVAQVLSAPGLPPPPPEVTAMAALALDLLSELGSEIASMEGQIQALQREAEREAEQEQQQQQRGPARAAGTRAGAGVGAPAVPAAARQGGGAPVSPYLAQVQQVAQQQQQRPRLSHAVTHTQAAPHPQLAMPEFLQGTSYARVPHPPPAAGAHGPASASPTRGSRGAGGAAASARASPAHAAAADRRYGTAAPAAAAAPAPAPAAPAPAGASALEVRMGAAVPEPLASLAPLAPRDGFTSPEESPSGAGLGSRPSPRTPLSLGLTSPSGGLVPTSARGYGAAGGMAAAGAGAGACDIGPWAQQQQGAAAAARGQSLTAAANGTPVAAWAASAPHAPEPLGPDFRMTSVSKVPLLRPHTTAGAGAPAPATPHLPSIRPSSPGLRSGAVAAAAPSAHAAAALGGNAARALGVVGLRPNSSGGGGSAGLALRTASMTLPTGTGAAALQQALQQQQPYGQVQGSRGAWLASDELLAGPMRSSSYTAGTGPPSHRVLSAGPNAAAAPPAASTPCAVPALATAGVANGGANGLRASLPGPPGSPHRHYPKMELAGAAAAAAGNARRRRGSVEVPCGAGGLGSMLYSVSASGSGGGSPVAAWEGGEGGVFGAPVGPHVSVDTLLMHMSLRGHAPDSPGSGERPRTSAPTVRGQGGERGSSSGAAGACAGGGAAGGVVGGAGGGAGAGGSRFARARRMSVGPLPPALMAGASGEPRGSGAGGGSSNGNSSPLPVLPAGTQVATGAQRAGG